MRSTSLRSLFVVAAVLLGSLRLAWGSMGTPAGDELCGDGVQTPDGCHGDFATEIQEELRVELLQVGLRRNGHTTKEVPNNPLYSCESNFGVPWSVQQASKKGLCVDDTTLLDCPNEIPYIWPNTNDKVSSLRLFSACRSEWEEWKCDRFWENIGELVRATGIKLFVGVGVTCNESEDEIEWSWTKKYLAQIGAEHVMGIALGNEMEMLQMQTEKAVSPACLKRLWQEEGFLQTFRRRVAELDELHGFSDVPVTTVLGGYALKGPAFVEEDGAKILSFLQDATGRYGRRFVFTFNFYPYFDPNMYPDAGGKTCDKVLKVAACLKHGCVVNQQLKIVRQRIQHLTGRTDDPLWLGEVGWSSSLSETLSTHMTSCRDWSSEQTLEAFYRSFLDWDLSVGSVAPPDHVFYFTIRDSFSYGHLESFGLIQSCGNATCKLRK